METAMNSPKLIIRTFFALILMLTAVVSFAKAAEDNALNSKLPIRKVVLYKHGVGYFERAGIVQGSGQVKLYFRRDQMNDLLKSMTVRELGSDRIGTIVYDSTRTIDQLLGEYSFKLSRSGGLPSLLEQIQGSQIELELPGESATGTIVSVEKRISKTADTATTEFLLTILDQNSQIRSFNTDEIITLRFLDERLDGNIKGYLQTVFQRHRKDEKTVTIETTGTGEHELLVSYVAETPVWKATYRIVLPDEQASESCYLQGWAIVDNVSEENWENVELSLVSGLPVSFIQNLYDPIFKKRPVIEIDTQAAVRPTVPEVPMMAKPAKALRKPMAAGARMADSMAPKEAMEEDSFAAFGRQMRQVESQASTRGVGDLFEYRIDHPVSITRNRSALLPIVSADINGEKVALYNEAIRTQNPMAAFRLENSTGLTLEGGPLTVYDRGSYVGEALIETVKPNEKRYITYAVDLSLHVNTNHGSKSERIDRVIINRGTIRRHRGVVETKTYNLDNKSVQSRNIIIEHPYRNDWKLLEKLEPIEVTDNYRRFEVEAPGEKSTKFVVRELRDSWDTLSVVNITNDDLVIFILDKHLTKESREQLEEILDLKRKIAATQNQVGQLKAQQQNIFQDQQRLRENLAKLRETAEEKKLRSRYVQKLGDQETELAGINDQLAQLENDQRDRQKQLNNLIELMEQDLSL